MAGNMLAHEIHEEMKQEQADDEYDEEIWELFSSDEEEIKGGPEEETKEPKIQRAESEKPLKKRRNTE